MTGSSRLAPLVDHTLLKPDATAEQFRVLAAEARQFGFAAVCVPPSRVALVTSLLRDSEVRVATVIGFPHGNTLAAVKSHEAELSMAAGARELDVVIAVGALKEGDFGTVRSDLAGVVAVARRSGALVKVILETALLSDPEKRLACGIAEEAGADFVKTSTGFGPHGATVEDVALLREAVGTRLGVKASGGIRDLASARALVAAGASRLGCSASVAIVREELAHG
jgi:deoxyribose-phosphate aldolase